MIRLTLLLFLTAIVLSCSRNTPPVIEYFVAEPDSVFPGDTVTITFRVSDADDDGIHYMLSKSSGTWGTDFGSIEPTKWIAPKEPGDYYLTLMTGDLTDQVADSVLIHVFDTVGVFTDSRDGHSYKWVKISSQIWMGENLAYLPSINSDDNGSYSLPYYYVYFRGDVNLSNAKASEYYNIFGVLYNFEASQTACPVGWHLPHEYEWRLLEQNLGMNTNDIISNNGIRNSGLVGGKLKEPGTSYWYEPNSGANNLSGFNALPSGMRSNLGGFHRLGLAAQFWTSTIYGMEEAWYRHLWYDNDGIGRGYTDQRDGHSVRCVKDE